ncbi:Cation channel sperm-associated protein 1 [Coelomomyces lativittatus]|nr:Cation channel sperm-associated protein 1 [Coelomomyces lativittatus]
MSSIISFLLPVFFHSSTSFDPKVIRLFRVFRALRAIRSLRALRAITFLRSLQVIVQTLLRSIPAMSSILSLSGLILYIFAVIGRTLFSTLDPKFFGTLGISIFRLFAFITLDNWSDAFRTNTSTIFPSVFFFQFFYVILESFVFLNLFIAVIVSNLSEVQKRSAKVQRMDLLEADTNARASRNATDKYQNSLRTLSKDFNLMDILQSDQGIENYYPPHLNRRTKQLLSIYFMEVAALERFGNFYSGHVQTLEDLVDLIQSKKGKR